MAVFVGHPGSLFVVLIVLLIGAVAFGAYVLRRVAPLPEEDREDFNLVQTATLTLLALLVGFSLSMAVGRYDQRKNLEEAKPMRSERSTRAPISPMRPSARR